MASTGLRRLLLLAASALTLLLAACGSSSIYEPFVPTRMVVVGDAFADLGQNGFRYTVNDGSAQSNWTERVAASWGLTLRATPTGTSYAVGSARVSVGTDPAGRTIASVTDQITAFLAAGGPQAGDLVVVNAGTADVIAEVQSISGAYTEAQAVSAIGQAGAQLALQVQRLVNAGAKHVLVVGTYSMDRSPWAISTSQTSRLLSASSAFNDRLKLDMQNAGLGNQVFYVDLDTYLRTFTIANPSVPACTSTVATSTDTKSIGNAPYIENSVSSLITSATCDATTIRSGADYSTYLFADPVYLTPGIHRGFGDYVATRLRVRW